MQLRHVALHVDKNDFELETLMPEAPECWD